MALVREKDGRRLHVKSNLMGESLVGKSFAENLKVAPQQRLFPDCLLYTSDAADDFAVV